ncbi:tld protein, partial [Cystoisospora suis]
MLPLDFVLRIYGAFLYEGVNVFFRYSVALLKLLESSLLDCTHHEAAEDVLYNCGDDPLITLDGLS